MSFTLITFLTSVPIAKFLYSKSILCVGTCRGLRKYLPDKICKPGKLSRGESITFQSGRLANLSVTIWRDKKEERFLSTLNKPNIITKCICRIGNRRVEVETPSTAASYSRYYSAVDKYDRLCSHKVYGSLGHGSSKVWKHLLWQFTNMAIANAWILFQKYSTRENPKYYDHLAFRQELVKQLIGGFSSRKKVSSSCPTLSTNVQINMLGHQLVRMPCKRP